MEDAVLKVLAIFRRYRVGPGQMLFIHNLDDGLSAAMARLMDDGLVTRRPQERLLPDALRIRRRAGGLVDSYTRPLAVKEHACPTISGMKGFAGPERGSAVAFAWAAAG